MKIRTITNSWIDSANWESKKDNFKARFPLLTDADLNCALHPSDSMLENLQRKLGLTSDELAITIITL
ncbi:MAG TPA: hypothetical protein VD884_08820 [Ohtaekwangia sp.]|nr:hypothetical protein [Ohtaekwangia sp.]